MNKELNKVLNDIRVDTLWGYNDNEQTDDNLLELIKQDYEDCIDLRNRIAESTDNEPPTLYEEDHLTLDHILDYMEHFYNLIKILTQKGNNNEKQN